MDNLEQRIFSMLWITTVNRLLESLVLILLFRSALDFFSPWFWDQFDISFDVSFFVVFVFNVLFVLLWPYCYCTSHFF